MCKKQFVSEAISFNGRYREPQSATNIGALKESEAYHQLLFVESNKWLLRVKLFVVLSSRYHCGGGWIY